jgi:hypothetical protein
MPTGSPTSSCTRSRSARRGGSPRAPINRRRTPRSMPPGKTCSMTSRTRRASGTSWPIVCGAAHRPNPSAWRKTTPGRRWTTTTRPSAPMGALSPTLKHVSRRAHPSVRSISMTVTAAAISASPVPPLSLPRVKRRGHSSTPTVLGWNGTAPARTLLSSSRIRCWRCRWGPHCDARSGPGQVKTWERRKNRWHRFATTTPGATTAKLS